MEHVAPPTLHPEQLQDPYTFMGQGGDHIVIGNPYIELGSLRRIETDECVGPSVASKYSRLAFIALNTPGVTVEEAYAQAVVRADRVNCRFERMKDFFGLCIVDQQSEAQLLELNSEEVGYVWGAQ